MYATASALHCYIEGDRSDPIQSYHNEGERSEKRSDRIEWYYMIMKVND